MTYRNRTPSFADFDKRARDQDALNIVFMGGSLTWGANTTDPELYSYRALISDHLRARYPHTPLRFWDAAIGGQGSPLSVFRLDRDVIRREPDLFFLEYAVNDDTTDVERLASFESLVRRIIEEVKCPVVVSILAVRDDVTKPPSSDRLHETHQRIAQAYGCGLAVTASWIHQQIISRNLSIEDLWGNPLWPVPDDHVHPGNLGQALYAEFIWNTFVDAVAQSVVCHVPEEMLYASTYMEHQRFRLSEVTSLPQGWQRGEAYRVAGAYDFLMSRWLDGVITARGDAGKPTPEPLTLKFKGQSAFLLGEATPTSGKYRVTIDGQPAVSPQCDSSGVFNAATMIVGNMPLFSTLGLGLIADQTHAITIEPILSTGQELRFESLCVAGKDAWVGAAPTSSSR